MIKKRLDFLKGNWVFVVVLNLFLFGLWYVVHQFLKEIYFQKTIYSLEQDLNEQEDLEKIIHAQKYKKIFMENESLLRNVYVFDSLIKQEDYRQLERLLKELPPPIMPEFSKFKEKFNLENLEKKDTKALEEKNILKAILRNLVQEKATKQ